MSKVEVNQISSQCGSTLTVGQSGDTVTLACGATQTGFGRTGTVDWDTTAKTASFTAVSGDGYFVNTTSGAITVTLPAGSAGSIVSLKDYANTWDTNNVTVIPNGTDKINGVNDSAILSTQDQSVTLVYVDSTKGWRVVQDSTSDVTGASFIAATGGTITCCGDYKIHTFTSPGTFTVTCAGSGPEAVVDYLIVAGGGGGARSGPGNNGSGGGGGGFRESKATGAPWTASPLATCASLTVTATGYPITVGGGGSAGPGPDTCGSDGSNSIFSTITSTAGGGGTRSAIPGRPGGSGSGGSGGGFNRPGGTGNTPPVSPPQGQPGGISAICGADNAGGGGGGATEAGVNGTPAGATGGGRGGAGATTSISGSSSNYSGGGGTTNGAGSPCGTGGAGGPNPGNAAGSGTTNTGGAGGGTNGNGTAGSGGSGIVIIRYKYQ